MGPVYSTTALEGENCLPEVISSFVLVMGSIAYDAAGV